jgi:hypothetical protein
MQKYPLIYTINKYHSLNMFALKRITIPSNKILYYPAGLSTPILCQEADLIAAVGCRDLAFGFYGFMGFGLAGICCWGFAVAGFRCKDSVLAENSCRVFVFWYLMYGITIAQLRCRSFGLGL